MKPDLTLLPRINQQITFITNNHVRLGRIDTRWAK